MFKGKKKRTNKKGEEERKTDRQIQMTKVTAQLVEYLSSIHKNQVSIPRTAYTGQAGPCL